MSLAETEIFDSHLHIVDPRFPLVPNKGWLPAAFTVEDYTQAVDRLGLIPIGGVVVSGSFQSFDQTYLVDALARLGPRFVGVTQLRPDATDEAIRKLDTHGVRGVRFNLRRGVANDLEVLEQVAFRVANLVGWHVELYATPDDIVELEPRLRRLPAASIDHVGLCKDPTSPGSLALTRLVEAGVQVKATGFGRTSGDSASMLAHLAAVRPTALMFGTDLPSTRANRPFERQDMERVCETVSPEIVPLILADNGRNFYGDRLQPTSRREAPKRRNP